ncbi:hypothetical protein [Maricurvus nonylphenolicus]|uniref:hypothetical protein n=1 Tax=Maricurvus nonylphenolicus TaxID=1008307 RepID=UPI0036F217CB
MPNTMPNTMPVVGLATGRHLFKLLSALLLSSFWGAYSVWADEFIAQDMALVGLTSQVTAISQSRIDDNAFSQVQGLVKVNAAAGDGNIQQNSAAAAASNGVSVAAVKASQTSDQHNPQGSHAVSAVISGDSFQQAQGILMINQAAGYGNRQVNAAAIAIGGLGTIAVVQLDEKTLSEEATDSGLDAGSESLLPEIVTEVGIDPSAFHNARGILMLNQSAGMNNVSGNSFTLSVTH